MNVVWKSFGVSMIGPGHIKNGIPNQDYFMEKHRKHFDCIVVSDGVGACIRSDRGAQVACRAVIDTISAFNVESLLTTINLFVDQIKKSFLTGIAPFPSEECAATCLWAIHFAGKVVLGMLGDGLAACLLKDGTVATLIDDKTERFSNLVLALSEKVIPENWKYIEIPEEQCRAILLCTDGISDDLDDINGFVCGFSNNCINKAKDTNIRTTRNMLLNWPVPKHSDDKTIVCLYPVEVADEELF